MKWFLLALGLLVSVKLSANIWRIWKSGNQVTVAQKELQVAQKQQQDLQLQLAAVQSPEFIEKEAREKLGYGKPGEVIVILPKLEDKASKKVMGTVPVWKQWWDLYVGI